VQDLANEALYYFPEDSFALYLIASVLIVEKKYKEAREILYKALKNNPNVEEIYTDLGFILSSVDRNYKGAIEIMNMAFKKGIASSLTLNNMAYSLIKLGDIQAAERLLLKIKKPYPPAYFATKGMIAIRKGFIKKGEALYYKAVKMLDDSTNKIIAKQILNLEKAKYFIKIEDKSMANRYIKHALRLGKTYVNDEIQELLSSGKCT
jgi:tetratricopeptide (TPR) repeat protein